MANILPDNMRVENRRRYFARLFAIILYGLAFLLVVSAALIVPSYFLLDEEREALSSEQRVLGGGGGGESRSVSVAELADRAKRLSSVKKEFSPTEYIETVVSILPVGIAASSISFEEQGDGSVKFTISGLANTRESLVSFRDSLEARDSFSGVKLPVTQLAQRTDLGFSISATIKP